MSSQYNNINKDRIDLVFQKQTEQVQSKLMQLLVHYNASLQYNSKEDKFQVDVLLPFQDQIQKSSFLNEFYKNRSNYPSIQSQKQNQIKNSKKNKNSIQYMQDYERKNIISQSQPSERIQNDHIIIQKQSQKYKENRQKIIEQFTKKNQQQINSQLNNRQSSQKNSNSNSKLSSSAKLSYNHNTNLLQLQISQNNNEKDRTSVSTKILSSVNFQSISKSLDQNIFKAIKNIKIQKKKQDSSYLQSQTKNKNKDKIQNSILNQDVSKNQNHNDLNRNGLKSTDLTNTNDIISTVKNNSNTSNPFQKKKIKQSQQNIIKIQKNFQQQQSTLLNNKNTLIESPISVIKGNYDDQSQYQKKQQIQGKQYKIQNILKIKQYNKKKQVQSLSSTQIKENISKIPLQSLQQNRNNQDYQYNSPPSKSHEHQSHINSNGAEILIQDQSGYSQEYSNNQYSIESTIQSNNQNFSSFIINKIIEENMEHQQSSSSNQDFQKNIENAKFQKQIQLFPNSDRKNYQYSPRSYHQRYTQYKKSHKDYLLDKYKLPQGGYRHDNKVSRFSNNKEKSKDRIQNLLEPNITMKKSYNQFFKSNQKNLQKVYQQIRNDIKKNKGSRYAAHLKSSRTSSESNSILIQQDDYPYQQQDQNSEQAIFKSQVMQHYTDKIVVTNQAMSSQDLVRYFRYLLRNAKSLYVKHMKKKNTKNIAQNKFNKPFK